ncbi:MAG: hypothetical protein JSR61_02405 [Proteobacteria bacterium]|nr:hypothetical protein [Pseudomonadota bacterium]
MSIRRYLGATLLVATLLVATLLVATLFVAQAAQADPMKCSGEEATCRQSCAQLPKGTLSSCLTACGARRSACMRTGCWDDGRLRYCGLAKQ